MSLIWAIFRQRIYPELNGGISVKWKMIFLNDEAFLKLLCSLLSSIKVHFHINQNSVAKNKINLSQFKHRGIQNWALNVYTSPGRLKKQALDWTFIPKSKTTKQAHQRAAASSTVGEPLSEKPHGSFHDDKITGINWSPAMASSWINGAHCDP